VNPVTTNGFAFDKQDQQEENDQNIKIVKFQVWLILDTHSIKQPDNEVVQYFIKYPN
jgi:hypothetical protein